MGGHDVHDLLAFLLAGFGRGQRFPVPGHLPSTRTCTEVTGCAAGSPTCVVCHGVTQPPGWARLGLPEQSTWSRNCGEEQGGSCARRRCSREIRGQPVPHREPARAWRQSTLRIRAGPRGRVAGVVASTLAASAGVGPVAGRGWASDGRGSPRNTRWSRRMKPETELEATAWPRSPRPVGHVSTRPEGSGSTTPCWPKS